MKKNLFFGMLMAATVAFVGCSKEDSPNETPAQKADTQSYLSVQVVPAQSTRTVTDGNYVDGSDQECAVGSVDFYFFKADGTPFLLTAVEDHTATGGAVNTGYYDQNRYSLPTDMTFFPNSNAAVDQGTNQNIDAVVNTTLVIEHNSGNIPAYIVVVLNNKNDDYKNVNIDKLFELTRQYPIDYTTGRFIMTNSVYLGAGNAIQMATPITTANLGTTANEALANPVEVYVERVAARVSVKEAETASEDQENVGDIEGAYKTEKEITMSDGTTKKVAYAKILGWDINTTANSSYAFKNVEGWDAWGITWAWNKAADYRSFWANSIASEEFTGNLNNGLTANFNWNAVAENANKVGDVDYCMENTYVPARKTKTVVTYNADGTQTQAEEYDEVETRINNTKVVVATQLYDGEGNELAIANWYGQNYDVADLKAVVAGALGTKLLAKEETTDADGNVTNVSYTPISKDDINLRQGKGVDGEDSYKVYFEFTDEAKAKDWSYITASNEYADYADAEAGEVLYATKPAKVWNGMSYYFVNIEHLGATTADDGLKAGDYVEGYYGVVRNHAYEIIIDGLTGLGTPVFNDGTNIPYPVIPDETESFISAKINVLSWHLIQQNVTLQ